MFERKSMEQIVSKMIKWTRGATTKLTDFRVGSKVRTIYEAVAVVVEEFYDRVYRTMRQLIEENIYGVFGFDKIPSTYATGLVTFSRSTVADQDYYIPAGTLLQKNATEYVAPINYRTTEDAVLAMGTTSINAPIVCETAGVDGNTGANTVIIMVGGISGIEAVTNLTALTNGQDEETKEEQKLRFQRFMDANARGVLGAVEYGATLASRVDDNGITIERVTQSKALEYLPERKGEVDLYVWNGVDGASEALIAEVRRIEEGYYDEDGKVVYGYKPAGNILNIYVAPRKYLKVKVDLTPEIWLSFEDAQTIAEREIDGYFGSLKMGQTVVQTEIESRIKRNEGVYDVKLYLSTDNGATYSTNNVVTASEEVALVSKPIVFNQVGGA
jgi:uncharacterized phage protein gp47/JayE